MRAPILVCFLVSCLQAQFVQQARLQGRDESLPPPPEYCVCPGIPTVSFGASVAVSADGNTVIVGGPQDYPNGAAWAFTRSNGAWNQQGGKLVGSVTGSFQGGSVGISGDGNTVLFGGNDLEGPAIWIFTRRNGTWSLESERTILNDPSGACSTGPVALSADGNTASVAVYANTGGSGELRVFTRSTGAWVRLPGSEGAKHVSISGDGNTIIGGIPGTQNGTGATIVFARANGAWAQQATLIGTDPAFTAQQGWAVALSADGNTAIEGGPDRTYFHAAAWVFTRKNGIWTQQAGPLDAPRTIAIPAMTASLSADGNTAVAGGSVFHRDASGTWTQTGELAQYWGSAAISADGGTVVLGDSFLTQSAVVYTGPPSAAPVPVSVTPASGQSSAQTFTFTFSDPGGWPNLRLLDILIASSLDGRHACYIAFAPMNANSGALYLVDDAGDAAGPYAGMILPGVGTVQNSQCSIDGGASAVSANGNNLTLTLPITFTSTFIRLDGAALRNRLPRR